ncbi:MAG TPA: hypothetical protein ENN67_02205, partial [Firmicutes bacterium]|nr:hypothetical protein [Bacillota bacterium]
KRQGIDPSDVEAYIVFLDPATVVNIELTREKLDRVINIINALDDASRNNNFSPHPDPTKCSWCDYSDLCPHRAAEM